MDHQVVTDKKEQFQLSTKDVNEKKNWASEKLSSISGHVSIHLKLIGGQSVVHGLPHKKPQVLRDENSPRLDPRLLVLLVNKRRKNLPVMCIEKYQWNSYLKWAY